MNNRYTFYFDESFHSRVINKSTIDSDGYFDSYVCAGLGFKNEENYKSSIKEFENKVKKSFSINDDIELKSSVVKKQQYKYGLKTFNEKSLQLYMEFWKLLEKLDIIPYIYTSSKLEYILRQINFKANGYIYSKKAFIYIIIKAINVYRPPKILNMLMNNDCRIIDELKKFLENKIIENKNNPIKVKENMAFEQVLILMDSIKEDEISLNWEYTSIFVGIEKLLMEKNILKDETQIVIDREGEKNNTISACRKIGFKNAIEMDSKECIELRCSDLLSGFIGKMMRAIYDDTKFDGGKYDKKIVLSEEWFMLNEEKFNLYKQIARTIRLKFNNYYSTFVSVYFDLFYEFISFIYYIDNYQNFEEYNKFSSEAHREKEEAFLLFNLDEKYKEVFSTTE